MAGPIPADAFGSAVSADIDRTIALWVEGGLDANKVWFELTGQRRRYAAWSEVKGLMLGWERRRMAAAQRDDEAKLLLPGLGRRAA